MKVYIAGKITGDATYKEKFAFYAAAEKEMGNIPLSPALLPEGMSKEDYMRICFAMIDSADEVHFISDWCFSEGAVLEKKYCDYTEKSVYFYPIHPVKDWAPPHLK